MSVTCVLCFLPVEAVGLGVAYVRLGGLQGGHRLAKYNRLIAIEEELAQQGTLGRGPLAHCPHLHILHRPASPLCFPI